MYVFAPGPDEDFYGEAYPMESRRERTGTVLLSGEPPYDLSRKNVSEGQARPTWPVKDSSSFILFFFVSFFHLLVPVESSFSESFVNEACLVVDK